MQYDVINAFGLEIHKDVTVNQHMKLYEHTHHKYTYIPTHKLIT